MDNRKKIEDMTPSPRRSSRALVKGEIRREVRKEEMVKETKKELKKVPKQEIVVTKKKASTNSVTSGVGFSKTLGIFVSLVLAFAIVAIAIAMYFSSGTIIVKPKVVTVNLEDTFVSAREKPLASELGYQTLSLSDIATSTVTAVQGNLVEKKAVGTITLYNNIGTSTQKIITGTRLSSPTGLIYHTTKSVVIPGQKVVGGKIVPGSIKVSIIADVAGSLYNLSLLDTSGDFKVVAYLGGPKYTKVYGRLATALTGGYSGKLITPDSKSVEIEVSKLKKILEARLLANSKNIVPKNYVLYDNAYRINYEIIPPVSNGNDAVIGVKALYTGYILNQISLVKSIARDAVNQFPENGFKLSGVDNLSFRFATTSFPKTSAFSSATTSRVVDKISFILNGSVKIIGIIPTADFIKDMTGIRIEDSAKIIKKYSTITSASARIFPIWMRSLPDNPDRIKVEISQY